MNFVVAILLALAVFNVAFAEHKNELVLLGDDNIGEFVKSTRPVFNASALPAEYDLRKLGLLSTDLNQHIPVYCGSCWAHAPLSSLADRIRIKSKGLVRDVIPAVQVMINWATAGTCNGGDSNAANALIYKKGGIPDVTCQQYQAKNMEDTAINTCMNCAPGAGCEAVAEYPKIKVSEYGSVKGDANIMAEIYARGPVSAYINANCLETPEYTGGVIKYDTCITRTTNHAIQINGWGTDENGVDYWICRNSWGSYWGEHGFFRIVRGGNWNVGTAYWAEPAIEEFL